MDGNAQRDDAPTDSAREHPVALQHSASFASADEQRTVTVTLVAMAGVTAAFTLHEVAHAAGWLPYASSIGALPRETTLAAGASTLLIAWMAQMHRRGARWPVHVATLVFPIVVLPLAPPDAFTGGIPQVVWIGPLLAFALTSLRWGLLVTLITLGTVLLAFGRYGAFGVRSSAFVSVAITLLLVASKRRHEALLAGQRAQAEATLRAMLYNEVTGLPNRRLVEDRLAEGLKLARRNGRALAVLWVDIDGFKRVNEGLGHAVGDALIVEAARRVRGCVRTTDTLGHFGADALVLLLGDLRDRAAVDRVAVGVLSALAEPYALGSETVRTTASVGVAMYPDDGDGGAALLQRAEQALANAKAGGGDRAQYSTATLQEAAESRQCLARDLPAALADGQLSVHYQPIVDLRTGVVRKAEALVRWLHPTRGFVSPATFIPVAESSGLIHAVGDFVFEQAAAQVKRWRDRYGIPLQVSVNRSPAQFPVAVAKGPVGGTLATRSASNRDLPRPSWPDQLRALDLPGDAIAMEVTEGLLLDETRATAEEFGAMRAAGIAISLDDFGTGYSALAYLQRYPIDVVKIDRAFVRGLDVDAKNLALCRAIVHMAHELGMRVVAEGIEREVERDLLTEIGCDYGQGYLFGRPMPAEDFEQVLSRDATALS
jgi:diguanylate cyclase (GGDEF)-like protein